MTSRVDPAAAAACRAATQDEPVDKARYSCGIGAEKMIVKAKTGGHIVCPSGAQVVLGSNPATVGSGKANERRPREAEEARCCNDPPSDREDEQEDEERASPPSSSASSLSSSGIYYNNSPLRIPPGDRRIGNGPLPPSVVRLPKIAQIPDGRPLPVPPKLPGGASGRWTAGAGSAAAKGAPASGRAVAARHCDYRKLVVVSVAPPPPHDASMGGTSAARTAGAAAVSPVVIPPPVPPVPNKRARLGAGGGGSAADASVISDDDDSMLPSERNPAGNSDRPFSSPPRQVYHQTIRYHPSNLSEEQLLFVEAASTLKRSPAAGAPDEEEQRRLLRTEASSVCKRGLAEVSESSSASSSKAEPPSLGAAGALRRGVPRKAAAPLGVKRTAAPLPPPPASLQAPVPSLASAAKPRRG
jgi:hypothetical protein